jgi:hypothetical protein
MRNSVAEGMSESDWDRLNSIADSFRRGIPRWEIGYSERTTPERAPRADNEPPVPLHLASGFLDDRRRALEPDAKHYAVFRHALRWQDTWREGEHWSFWGAALPLWPRGSGGKYSHSDALAYAIVLAVRRGVDLEAFLSKLNGELARLPPIAGLSSREFTYKGLERRRVLWTAIKMLETPQHPYQESGRIPRVVTDDELVPLLAMEPVQLKTHSAAGNASYAIVGAAQRAVSEPSES